MRVCRSQALCTSGPRPSQLSPSTLVSVYRQDRNFRLILRRPILDSWSRPLHHGDSSSNCERMRLAFLREQHRQEPRPFGWIQYTEKPLDWSTGELSDIHQHAHRHPSACSQTSISTLTHTDRLDHFGTAYPLQSTVKIPGQLLTRLTRNLFNSRSSHEGFPVSALALTWPLAESSRLQQSRSCAAAAAFHSKPRQPPRDVSCFSWSLHQAHFKISPPRAGKHFYKLVGRSPHAENDFPLNDAALTGGKDV